MEVYNFGNEESNTVLIQLVGDHDMALLANEVKLIRELSMSSDFRLIAIKVDNWNDDLSPWESPAVFGPEGFGGGADETLKYVLGEVIEPLKRQASNELSLYIGGYSLAGLFAFWTIYQSNLFSGCVAASPSAWFPGLEEYISDKEPLTDKIYLSLGDKEEKTRNPVMSQVGNAIRGIYDQLRQKVGVNVTLEWNQGNHFMEPDLRIAKGFAWILKLRRIIEMEELFGRVQKRMDESDIKKLEEYYDSPQWKADFEMDERGEIPPDLKRGVLSEDGVYNLLEGYMQSLRN